MKKVSIIIPLYNLEKLIGKCIASALGQDLSPEEYEILVIDDGSTDGSLAAAEKAAQGHPNVHVYTKPNELEHKRLKGIDPGGFNQPYQRKLPGQASGADPEDSHTHHAH